MAGRNGENPASEPSKYTTLSPGSDGAAVSDPEWVVNAALAAAKASISLCEPWKEMIVAALEQQLSAKRIHQDLVRDHGFVGAYQSVKRYVRKLERAAPVPYRRMEFAPGEQMQVDFGLGAWIREEGGRRRRPHVFRAVMCFSGKGYSEVVWNQKTETFLRCLENAFRYLGGVPATVCPDNLKAAVLHPDWFDPELNPKLAGFAEHYGTVILPTKPATPRHKGRVERGVDFVQENALKGRSFESLAAENTFLMDWERSVADTRIHGTTRQQVGKHFLEVERAALRPLPASLFPSFTEGKRKVHLDGHVEFDRSFYSVPPEYLGRELWVRGESRLIRIYTLKMEPVTVHARAEPGRSATEAAHIHPLKRRIADRGVSYMLSRCEEIGPRAGAWALAMHKHRGIEAVRVLQGLLSLARANPHDRLEMAAGKALERAGWRLSDLRAALAEPENVVQGDFLETHPLIREMTAYRIPLPP
jgi:transposase